MNKKLLSTLFILSLLAISTALANSHAEDVDHTATTTVPPIHEIAIKNDPLNITLTLDTPANVELEYSTNLGLTDWTIEVSSNGWNTDGLSGTVIGYPTLVVTTATGNDANEITDGIMIIDAENGLSNTVTLATGSGNRHEETITVGFQTAAAATVTTGDYVTTLTYTFE